MVEFWLALTLILSPQERKKLMPGCWISRGSVSCCQVLDFVSKARAIYHLTDNDAPSPWGRGAGVRASVSQTAVGTRQSFMVLGSTGNSEEPIKVKEMQPMTNVRLRIVGLFNK